MSDGIDRDAATKILEKIDRAMDPDRTPYMAEAWDLIVEARDELEEAIHTETSHGGDDDE